MIEFGAGVYYLDRPVCITRDNVVLRGAGAGVTRLVSRYAYGPYALDLASHAEGEAITNSSWLEAHAYPGADAPVIHDELEWIVIEEVTSGGTFVRELARFNRRCGSDP